MLVNVGTGSNVGTIVLLVSVGGRGGSLDGTVVGGSTVDDGGSAVVLGGSWVVVGGSWVVVGGSWVVVGGS